MEKLSWHFWLSKVSVFGVKRITGHLGACNPWKRVKCGKELEKLALATIIQSGLGVKGWLVLTEQGEAEREATKWERLTRGWGVGGYLDISRSTITDHVLLGSFGNSILLLGRRLSGYFGGRVLFWKLTRL